MDKSIYVNGIEYKYECSEFLNITLTESIKDSLINNRWFIACIYNDKTVYCGWL